MVPCGNRMVDLAVRRISVYLYWALHLHSDSHLCNQIVTLCNQMVDISLSTLYFSVIVFLMSPAQRCKTIDPLTLAFAEQCMHHACTCIYIPLPADVSPQVWHLQQAVHTCSTCMELLFVLYCIAPLYICHFSCR